MSTIAVGSIEAGAGEKAFGYVESFELPASIVRMPVWIINSGAPGPRVAVTAGMHGTEYVGIEAATRLARQTNPTDIRGALVVFPLVNVTGFEAADVLAVPIDGLNLNRVFPGDANGSPSQRLAHFLFESIRSVADAAIDLHGGDSAQSLHPFTVTYETGDAALDERSMEMARLFDMPFIWAMGPQTQTHPGMMISELNRHGIPAAIGEAGDLGMCREEDVQLHLRGISNILKYLGSVDGAPVLTRPSPPEVFGHNFGVVAHRGGVLDARVAVGGPSARGRPARRRQEHRGRDARGDHLAARGNDHVVSIGPHRASRQPAVSRPHAVSAARRSGRSASIARQNRRQSRDRHGAREHAPRRCAADHTASAP